MKPRSRQMFDATIRQVEMIAALVAPPGQAEEAVRVVREQMTTRAQRHQDPDTDEDR